MAGRAKNNENNFSFEHDGETNLEGKELAEKRNTYYISVNADIPPFDPYSLPSFLPAVDVIPTIQSYEVCNKLLHLKINKSEGPDNIPSYILREFSYKLAELYSTPPFHQVLFLYFGKTLILYQYQRCVNPPVRAILDQYL